MKVAGKLHTAQALQARHGANFSSPRAERSSNSPGVVFTSRLLTNKSPPDRQNWINMYYGGVSSGSTVQTVLRFALKARLKSLCFALGRPTPFSKFSTVTPQRAMQFFHLRSLLISAEKTFLNTPPLDLSSPLTKLSSLCPAALAPPPCRASRSS